jgi:signal transduction histidine kinase
MELNGSIPILPLVADQIQQVFVNILLNAVDIIIESPRGLEKDLIRVSSEVDEDQVIIEFYDNGSGIADENLAKVFEPFYTTKKEGKGTGLGLWVSYGIIKSFQGDLKVSSKLGEGTTFKITLPIHP